MKIRELIEVLKKANYYDYVSIFEEVSPALELKELFSATLDDEDIPKNLLDQKIIKSFIGEYELSIIIGKGVAL